MLTVPMRDDVFQIVDLLIKLLPLGLFIGLSVVFGVRWAKARRHRAQERQAQERQAQETAHSSEHIANAIKDLALRLRAPASALLDVFLLLYLLFDYEWSHAIGQIWSILPIFLTYLIFAPHLFVKSIAPFGLAALFFICLAASIFMTRFRVGPWPRPLKIATIAIMPVILARLIWQWGMTMWGLTQAFPSADTPLSVGALLIVGLFSACGGRRTVNDTAVSIGQSTGMFLLEWLAAIYIAEKYFRAALFHNAANTRGWARRARFTPVLPVLLIGVFLGTGLWGDLQHWLATRQAQKMETVVLKPKANPLLWHTAVEQCAAQGAEWRLPTQYELRQLSQSGLEKNPNLGGAWTAEAVTEKVSGVLNGAIGFRWAGGIHARPSYVPNVMGRCLSQKPTDLYQYLVTSLFPSLYQQHRHNSFYNYFYHHEIFYSNYSDVPSPEGVICIKPPQGPTTILPHDDLQGHTLVADIQTTVATLEIMCHDKTYAQNFCGIFEAQQLQKRVEADPALAEQDFQTRREKCRLTAESQVCANQGWYYVVRGDFERVRPFYEDACGKDGINVATCPFLKDMAIQKAAFDEAVEGLMGLGLVTTKPSTHKDMKEPLARACEQAHAMSCVYLGSIFELEQQRDAALHFFQRGCDHGLLRSCTRKIFVEKATKTVFQVEAELVPKLIDLCNRNEPSACAPASGWIFRTKPDEASALAAKACELGNQVECASRNEAIEASETPQSPFAQGDIRASTSSDIEGFHNTCARDIIQCRGYADRLAYQGQFQESEWFYERVCQGYRENNVSECAKNGVPAARRYFDSVTQELIRKKYLPAPPRNHETMMPALQRACGERHPASCFYLAELMYRSTIGHWPGSHRSYRKADLVRAFEEACSLNYALACTHAVKITLLLREGKWAAEERQIGLEQEQEGLRRYAELCKNRKEIEACQGAAATLISYFNGDGKRIPDDRASVRQFLEQTCALEAKLKLPHKPTCTQLNRLININEL